MEEQNKIIVRSVTNQITQFLKQSISEGKYEDGGQLPSLSRMAEEYSVSIATIREAVRKLEAVGMVEILHGKGVFVRNPKFPFDWLTRFTSFSESIRRLGKTPGARTLIAETIYSSELIAAQLELKENVQVHHLSRLRFADNDPIAIEETYLPAYLLPGFVDKFKDPISLYEFIEAEYGIQMASAVQILESTALTEEESNLLETKLHDPALLIKTTAFDIKGVPIELGHSLFRGDKYRYTVRLNK